MNKFDVVIIGTGPAGLGAAFQLIENDPSLKILILDQEKICSGGLLNDCKQNYTYPVGFPTEYWEKDEADGMLQIVRKHLNPKILPKANLDLYQKRAEKVKVSLINIEQAHVGTDKSRFLILDLVTQLIDKGVYVRLNIKVEFVNNEVKYIDTTKMSRIYYKNLIIAPGRKGFSFLQEVMNECGVEYIDNTVDVGIRIETKLENYPIVKDYYDPKFYFPRGVRTFCTNSGRALVTREKYKDFDIVNGHSLSDKGDGGNGLVNFAMLKTIGLKDPVRSGQQMASFLARLANEIGGGKPLMQRVGDFRAGKRSKKIDFNEDLYDFKPTCPACPGDLGLAVPSKVMRDLWASLKLLDTIIPGILHPSTILYYPEIKMYANKPKFIDKYFKVAKNLYMIGDGAGTSRGITGAWSSGIRAANGIIGK